MKTTSCFFEKNKTLVLWKLVILAMLETLKEVRYKRFFYVIDKKRENINHVRVQL